MRKLLALILLLPLCVCGQRYTVSTVLVICECGYMHKSEGIPDFKRSIETDSIWVTYCFQTTDLNDSIVKYVGADSLNVETIMIANPGNVLNNIYFGRFPNLQHLILAGNDFSDIDSIRYDFFNNKKLKLITFSSVYLNTAADAEPDWNVKKRMTQFIHGQRSDIRLKFVRMGEYNDILWD